MRKWFYRNIYLKTPYWKWIHNIVGQRANWKCQVRGCHQYGHWLNAHHIKYHLWFEWLNLKNLVYLCPKHHAQLHSGFYITLKSGRDIMPYSWNR